MHKILCSFFNKNDAIVDKFEIGQGVDNLVLIFDMNFEGVMMVGKINQAVTFIDGSDCLKRPYLVLMQINHLQFE